jgi:hypothetical protein
MFPLRDQDEPSRPKVSKPAQRGSLEHQRSRLAGSSRAGESVRTPPMGNEIDAYWASLVSTEPINRLRAAQSINRLYAGLGDAPPEIMFVPSPLAGLRMAATLTWLRNIDYFHTEEEFVQTWSMLPKPPSSVVTGGL